MLTMAGLICFATLMKVRDRSCGEGKGGCACCAKALDRNSKPSPEPTARANAKTRIRVLLSFLLMLLTLISISVQTSLTYHERQEYSDKKRVTSLFGSVTRLYVRINHYFLTLLRLATLQRASGADVSLSGRRSTSAADAQVVGHREHPRNPTGRHVRKLAVHLV